MSSPITHDTLEHLARLARLELDPKEEEKLLKDLQSILNYFKELLQVKTEGGQTPIDKIPHKNVFREDGDRENTNHKEGIDQIPAQKDGFLEIPKVFED